MHEANICKAYEQYGCIALFIYCKLVICMGVMASDD